MNRSLHVGDTRISYRQWGSGAPLVLLQAENHPHPDHRRLSTSLGDHHSLYTVAVEEGGLEAENLHRFLNRMGIARVSLMAAKETADLALTFCQRYPRQVDRLILVCEPRISAPVVLREEVSVLVTSAERVVTDTLDFLGRRPALAFEW